MSTWRLTTASASVVDAAIARYPLIDVTSEASLRAHTLASVIPARRAARLSVIDGLAPD
jgi:hypothetical protein